MKASQLAAAAVILAFTAGSASAAPCDTGATKSKSPNEATNQKSSDVDKGSKNLAGGQQPASPGTVGAMNNVGANQTSGQQGSGGQTAQSNSTDPAAKNLAGGQQPASPGTVGAMNNAAEARQPTAKNDDC